MYMDLIKLKKISKSYDTNVLFSDFNLTIEQGSFVAVTGKSGAGKSTLLNMIGLLEEPDSGTIEICGIRNPTLHSRDGIALLRNKVGYLFQNFGLVESQTVNYNLKIASRFKGWNREKEKQYFAEALKQVNLPGIENKKIYQLSGGEQQRVSIAKLIIKSPDVILADEPTGSLDSENRDAVMSLLGQMNDDGKTILLVTHDEEVKKCAKEFITL